MLLAYTLPATRPTFSAAVKCWKAQFSWPLRFSEIPRCDRPLSRSSSSRANSSELRIDGSSPSGPGFSARHDSMTVPPVTVKIPIRKGGLTAAATGMPAARGVGTPTTPETAGSAPPRPRAAPTGGRRVRPSSSAGSNRASPLTSVRGTSSQRGDSGTGRSPPPRAPAPRCGNRPAARPQGSHGRRIRRNSPARAERSRPSSSPPRFG